MNRLTGDRERNTMAYDLARLQTEACVIQACVSLGAIDLRPPPPTYEQRTRRKAGFDLPDREPPRPG